MTCGIHVSAGESSFRLGVIGDGGTADIVIATGLFSLSLRLNQNWGRGYNEHKDEMNCQDFSAALYLGSFCGVATLAEVMAPVTNAKKWAHFSSGQPFFYLLW